MNERRSLKRRDLLFNVRVNETESGRCIGHAVDVNLQGLKISTSEDFMTGQRLRLTIELPQELMGRRVIDLFGIVRWCAPDSNRKLRLAGIQISSIAPEDSETLLALMAYYTFSL
jgi:hypothetical protein